MLGATPALPPLKLGQAENGLHALRGRNVGHTFTDHGPQMADVLSMASRLHDPRTRRRVPQGMWVNAQDREAIEAFLRSKLPCLNQKILGDSGKCFTLPRGIKAVVFIDGKAYPTNRVRIVPDGRGGIKTAHPIVPDDLRRICGVSTGRVGLQGSELFDEVLAGTPSTFELLSRELGFPLDGDLDFGQDWERLHADADRVPEFLEAYAHKSRAGFDRYLLFGLGLFSMDASLSSGTPPAPERVQAFEDFARRHAAKHPIQLSRWRHSSAPLAALLRRSGLLPGQ